MKINNDFLKHDISSKKQVYALLDENMETVSKAIEGTVSDAKLLGLNPRFDNVGIIFRNKVTELSQVFIRTGMSFFTNSISTSNEGQYDDSFVGNAILDYLREINKIAIESLFLYRDEIMELTRHSSHMKAVAVAIKSFLGMSKISEEKKKSFILMERKYKNLATSLLNFSIKEHGYDAIIRYIGKDMDDEAIRGILLDEVFPTLEKLGYPEIIEKLKMKYETVLKDEIFTQNEKLREIMEGATPTEHEEWQKLLNEEIKYAEEIDDLLWSQELGIPASESESLYSELKSIFALPITNLKDFKDKIPKYAKLKEKILKKYTIPDGDITPDKKTTL